VHRLGEIDRSLVVGKDLLVVRNDRIDVAGARALRGGLGPSRVIISPGPCTPKEAGCSAAIIEAFAGVVPVLGVCLGHQTIGDMHGMTVQRHVLPVHGKTSPIRHANAGVFAGLANPFEATRYHSLVVLEETIPPPVVGQDNWQVTAWVDEPIEAGSDAKSPTGATRRVVMGLRRVWADAKKAPLEGVQFHPESFLTLEGPKLLANFLRA
jgi:anthranilate synthase/aminodeoxychorismate synthase-like glutamine amidotransferase